MNDESMEKDGQAIYNYLKNDLLSDTAEVRAKAYFVDLSMLKEFLDSAHGGVEKRVGYEIDCEKTVYQYAKMVYDGEITSEQAVKSMVKEVANAIEDILFEDSIFEGIIPKKNMTDTVLTDKNAVRDWIYSPYEY